MSPALTVWVAYVVLYKCFDPTQNNKDPNRVETLSRLNICGCFYWTGATQINDLSVCVSASVFALFFSV